MMASELVGMGLYSVKEASILTGITPGNIRRWLFGYKSSSKNQVEPLWHPQVRNNEVEGLGFHDLLEIRFVDAFRKYGVSLQSIRLASRSAKELYQSPYPFTCKHFRTDGQSIFAKVYEFTGEEKLLDLAKKQYVIREIISPSLYAGIEFKKDIATKWYPISRKKAVVLNPQILFGKPIVEKWGVPTSTLYEAYLVEQNKSFVARIFDVSVNAVSEAIQFEERFAA
jgi:uncharacterized protein (DUF433 family)/DNA-binding transcriptional MerR regulator